MKSTFMKAATVVAMGVLLTGAVHAAADDATAFSLIKEGNRFIGEQSRDKVMQIRSEKSVGTLTPSIWYVVYYDPDAKLKAVEVKFGAGQKMEVKRPLRVVEAITDHDRVIDRAKLKVDSDKALRTAAGEPLLKNLTLKASQMWLQPGKDGPAWKVRLWAAKLNNPNANADIGEVFISAEDGKIIRSDLHPNRVD